MKKKEFEQIMLQKLEELAFCDLNFKEISDECNQLQEQLEAHINNLPEDNQKEGWEQLLKYIKELKKKALVNREVIARERKKINIKFKSEVKDSLKKTPKGNMLNDIYATNGWSLIYTAAIQSKIIDVNSIVVKHMDSFIYKDEQMNELYQTLSTEQIVLLASAIEAKCLDALGAGNCGESADALVAETTVLKGLMQNKKFRYLTKGRFEGPRQKGGRYDHTFNVFFNRVNGQPDKKAAVVADKWTGQAARLMDFLKKNNPYRSDFTKPPASNALTIRWKQAKDLSAEGKGDFNMGKIYLYLRENTNLIQTCKTVINSQLRAAMKAGKAFVVKADKTTMDAADFERYVKRLKQDVEEGKRTRVKALQQLKNEFKGLFWGG